MPRPRYPHPTALIVLVSLALLLSACFQQPPEERHFVPGDSLHDQWSSSGQRLVIHTDDQPWIKLRLRQKQWRVYDDAFVPAGFLRSHDDGRIDVIDPAGQTVGCIDLDHPRRIALDDRFELRSQDSHHWTLHPPTDPEPIAQLQRSDEQWQLLLPSSPTPRVVDSGDRQPRIDPGDHSAFLLSSSAISEPAALVLTIDALSPLSRAALAKAIDGHRSFSDPD